MNTVQGKQRRNSMRDKISEKLLERKLARAVSELGGMALKFIPTFFIGAPDRLILMPGGKAYWVEVKSTGVKPRAIQLYVHKQLRALGFEVFVVDDNIKLGIVLEAMTGDMT
jgi:hypothetical protein